MQAIVLKCKDFRENDQIITFYSLEQGKINLLSTGSKKITSKLAGNLTPGNLLEIDIAPGKEINHLIKLNSLCVARNIRVSLEKQLVVAYIMNLTDELVKDGHRDSNIFLLLRDWLTMIDKDKSIYQENSSCDLRVVNHAVIHDYIVKLTTCLGFVPELAMCHKCVAKNDLEWFDLQGGLICNECCGKIPHKLNCCLISFKQIENWRKLLANDISDIKNLIIDDRLVDLIYKFVEFHLERKIRRIKL